MKIVLSNIPGYFPVAYNAQLYLGTRSVSSVKDYFFAESEQKFRITNDDSYRNRRIQTVFYDRYTIEFTATESIDVGLMAIAETISIIQDSGETHLAELIDFQEPSKMQDSEFRLYTITYRDLNSKTTIDHLTYDATDNPSYSAQLLINYEGAGFEAFNSKIILDLSISEYTRTSDDSNFLELVSSESASKTITYHAYLNETDKNFILQYVNGNAINGNEADVSQFPYVYIIYNSLNYEPIDTPIVTVDGGELEGLFYVTVTINYTQILNYPNE